MPSGAAWGWDMGGQAAWTLPALPLVSLDATTYAHFLFNAFDADGNGAIRFEVGPCRPLPIPGSCIPQAWHHPLGAVHRLRCGPGVSGPVCHPGNTWSPCGWPWAC